VPGAVIRERARLLRDVSGQLSARFRRTQVGRVHRALTIDDGTLALTGNYLKVRIAAGRARNEWVDLRVTDVADGVTGVVV
jgi:tRNA A37 methylthiotransferase MiaB